MQQQPKTKADLLAFLIENYQRLFLKSPKFFQIWQYIGLAALAVGFVPDILVFLDITPTEVFNDKLQIILKVAGGITWLQSRLPVLSNVAPETGSGKPVEAAAVLPFTEKKNPVTETPPTQDAAL